MAGMNLIGSSHSSHKGFFIFSENYLCTSRKDNPSPQCLHTPAVSSPEVIYRLGSQRKGLIRVDEAQN